MPQSLVYWRGARREGRKEGPKLAEIFGYGEVALLYDDTIEDSDFSHGMVILADIRPTVTSVPDGPVLNSHITCWS